MKDCLQQNSDDFGREIQRNSQAVQKIEEEHGQKVKSLESKCLALVETLGQQQQLIESANQQQKDSTQNRAAMLSIIEDWRSKTSEAMHTIIGMQEVESTIKASLNDERENGRRLQQALFEKQNEVSQLWQLVDRLADEVKVATNTYESLVKTIHEWNNHHEPENRLNIACTSVEESTVSSSVTSIASSIEKKKMIYSHISDLFPTSPEHRSDKFKHVNIPKLLMDSLNSSSCSIETMVSVD